MEVVDAPDGSFAAHLEAVTARCPAHEVHGHVADDFHVMRAVAGREPAEVGGQPGDVAADRVAADLDAAVVAVGGREAVEAVGRNVGEVALDLRCAAPALR
ncbi:MAG TPA: hypothetical protein VFG43_16040 [Geminicoccaceae bacterium]|nr:hypothetical protein [Geminicoccaceae bacterium]